MYIVLTAPYAYYSLYNRGWAKMSAESGDLCSPIAPPPPLPPPPLALGAPGLSASESKKKLYQTIASSRSAVKGDHTEACLLLRQRESRWI